MRYDLKNRMARVTDIIAALAKDIYRTLGSGHSEAAYQKAMEVGLRLQHVGFEAQKVIELTYQNHYIGEENIDLLVESNSQEVIVELKAMNQNLGPPEEQQLRNYMRGLSVELGVLINFPQPGRTKGKQKAEPEIEPEIKMVTL